MLEVIVPVAISAASLCLTVVTVVSGAIWTVGKINTTTQVLASRIDGLSKSIDKMEQAETAKEMAYISLLQRVTTLEAEVRK